jgi:signal transduction histidine kinase
VNSFLDEVIAYVQLTESDCGLLRNLHPKLEPWFPVVAERFYAAVRANPGAAIVLTGPEQAERLRGTLIDWMSSGLLGPYDDEFYAKRSRIGRRHVAIGLAQHYMFTAMTIVRNAYTDRVVELASATELAATLRAINKLLDIELAIMLHHYQADSEERMLERERRTLADRMSAMQTLSAGLAHEVRNPLNAARLQLELLERRLRRTGQDPKLVEPSELANHEIERLTALLDDFLAFARPPELHRVDQDIVEICRHVVDLERPYAQRRSVELTLDARVPVVAQVDPGKLHQVVQNLVRNGLEAAPSGGHVSVEVSSGAECVVHLQIADDGPGIPPEVLPRIYEPFFSTKDTGTGMGMAIVHSLVAMHGGKIEIATSSRGTRFDVVIPPR